MNTDVVLYILGAMIFWDLSIHFITFFGWVQKFTRSNSIFSYYYPHLRWKKTPTGPVVRENWERTYQLFWICYWSAAFALLVAYLLLK